MATHWRKWQQVSDLAMEIQARCHNPSPDDLKRLPELARLLNVKLAHLQASCDCEVERPQQERTRRTKRALVVDSLWQQIKTGKLPHTGALCQTTK